MKAFSYRLLFTQRVHTYYTLTVQELQAQLNKYPPEMPVFTEQELGEGGIGWLDFEVKKVCTNSVEGPFDALVIGTLP